MKKTPRVSNLTADQRVERGKNAVKVRWENDAVNGGTLKAKYTGDLKIGDLTIPCAVLEDGRRVLSETGMSKILGNRTGAARRLSQQNSEEGKAHLPVFLAQKQLEPYIGNSLGSGPLKVIKYRFVKTGEIMTIRENMEFWKNYQEQAWTTCMPSCQNMKYLTRGLLSEAGELVGKFKKEIRGDYDDMPKQFKQDVLAEVSDCLWYIFGIRTLLGEDHRIIAYSNIGTAFDNFDIRAFEAAYVLIHNMDSDSFETVISYLYAICKGLGFTLEDAATYNLEKLAKRYQTNKIIGSGDYR